MTFKKGDLAKIVANETIPHHHNLPMGTEVVILRPHEDRGTWYIRVLEEREALYENWAIESDLEPLENGEELDAEARKLFGLVETITFEKAHCDGWEDNYGIPVKHEPHLWDWGPSKVTRYCDGDGHD